MSASRAHTVAGTLRRAVALAPAAILAVLLGAHTPALGAPPARGRSALAGGAPPCVPATLNRSAVLPGTPLAVAPLPGSYVAAPSAQISMVGVPVHSIAGVRVTGSISGAHRGRLSGYSQGDGASFLPSTPFTPGETVTVGGTLKLGASPVPFSFKFAVAHQDQLPYRVHYPSGRDPNEVQHFRSRPELEPPAMVLSASSPATAPGDIFISPSSGPRSPGPMIFDEAGNLVWFDPLARGVEATNLQIQSYEGRPALTWWQGHVPEQGFGEGEEIIADSSYRPMVHLHAGNGLKADLHDFLINANGTALLTFFEPLVCNLAGVHASPDGWLTDSGFQEVDLRSGLVRREWHAVDHVALADSYNTPLTASAQWPFDFFHVNSLDAPASAPLLVSARNTSALYEVSPSSGQVQRRIGGRHSDVPLGPGAAIAYQHDATELPGGRISLFDNGANPKVHPQSRGLLVTLPGPGGSVSVLAQFLHPGGLSAGSQGSMQVLENGDVFIGWGQQPYFSEFSASGTLLFDGHLVGSYQSYRAFRFPWSGAPAQPPALAAIAPPHSGPVTAYASWNGDTRTASWRVLGGSSPHALGVLASAPRSGFETAIRTPGRERYVQVQALDAGGAVLGSSAVIHSHTG